jgi:hypothetical protein
MRGQEATRGLANMMFVHWDETPRGNEASIMFMHWEEWPRDNKTRELANMMFMHWGYFMAVSEVN